MIFYSMFGLFEGYFIFIEVFSRFFFQNVAGWFIVQVTISFTTWLSAIAVEFIFYFIVYYHVKTFSRLLVLYYFNNKPSYGCSSQAVIRLWEKLYS